MLDAHASLFAEVQPAVLEVAGKLADRTQLIMQFLAELIVAKAAKEQLSYRSFALHRTQRIYATKIAVALARYRHLAAKACGGFHSAETYRAELGSLQPNVSSASPATRCSSLSPNVHATTRQDSSSWRSSSFSSDWHERNAEPAECGGCLNLERSVMAWREREVEKREVEKREVEREVERERLRERG